LFNSPPSPNRPCLPARILTPPRANYLAITTDPQKGDAVTIPGKMVFDSGKSHFEMDMSQIKSSRLSADEAAQMKQLGIETIVTIARPDKKVSYIIYPGMQSYVENPEEMGAAATGTNDLKIESTELGKETIDGHSCVKDKVVITDKQGDKHEATVWDATDIKNFPVKIQMTGGGNDATMTFKNVSFVKPAADAFDPPASYTKYDSVQSMMMSQVMKQMGNALPH
jgi:hypothetical protein